MKLYGKLAKYYDLIYRDTFATFHEEYAKFAVNAWKKFCESGGRDLLDVACGTGELMKKLRSFGFRVWGLDVSEEMIEVAKKKLHAKFYLADMRDFELRKSFDVITCVFTSMNYILEKEDFEKTLRNFYRHLKDGGIVVFDFVEKSAWERKLGKVSITAPNDELVRFTYLQKEGKCVKSLMVFFFKRKGRLDFETDVHYHGLFSLREVKSFCKKAGFRKVLAFGDFKFSSYKPKVSTRAYFVCVK